MWNGVQLSSGETVPGDVSTGKTDGGQLEPVAKITEPVGSGDATGRQTLAAG